MAPSAGCGHCEACIRGMSDYRIGLKLVATGRVQVDRIIFDLFSLGELRQAYDTVMAGADGKVVLRADE